MGGALDAFGVMGDAVKRNPVLLAAAAIIGAASTVLNATGLVPFVGWFIALAVGFFYFFVEPFLAGGFLGMANQAVSGETALGDFLTHGKENYVSLLVARVIVAIPFLGYLVFALFFGGIFLGTGVMSLAGQGDPSGFAVGATGLFTLAIFAVFFVPFAGAMYILQFYPAAIVIGDADPLESFTYSYKLVDAHPVSALGYTAVAFVFGWLLVVPTLLSGGSQFAGQVVGEAVFGTGGGIVTGFVGRVAVFVVVFFILKTLVVAVLRTYYVSFVRSVTNTV